MFDFLRRKKDRTIRVASGFAHEKNKSVDTSGDIKWGLNHESIPVSFDDDLLRTHITLFADNNLIDPLMTYIKHNIDGDCCGLILNKLEDSSVQEILLHAKKKNRMDQIKLMSFENKPGYSRVKYFHLDVITKVFPVLEKALAMGFIKESYLKNNNLSHLISQLKLFREQTTLSKILSFTPDFASNNIDWSKINSYDAERKEYQKVSFLNNVFIFSDCVIECLNQLEKYSIKISPSYEEFCFNWAVVLQSHLIIMPQLSFIEAQLMAETYKQVYVSTLVLPDVVEQHFDPEDIFSSCKDNWLKIDVNRYSDLRKNIFTLDYENVHGSNINFQIFAIRSRALGIRLLIRVSSNKMHEYINDKEYQSCIANTNIKIFDELSEALKYGITITSSEYCILLHNTIYKIKKTNSSVITKYVKPTINIVI